MRQRDDFPATVFTAPSRYTYATHFEHRRRISIHAIARISGLAGKSSRLLIYCDTVVTNGAYQQCAVVNDWGMQSSVRGLDIAQVIFNIKINMTLT